MEEVGALETKTAQLEIELQTSQLNSDKLSKQLKDLTAVSNTEKQTLMTQLQQLSQQIVSL